MVTIPDPPYATRRWAARAAAPSSRSRPTTGTAEDRTVPSGERSASCLATRVMSATRHCSNLDAGSSASANKYSVTFAARKPRRVESSRQRRGRTEPSHLPSRARREPCRPLPTRSRGTSRHRRRPGPGCPPTPVPPERPNGRTTRVLHPGRGPGGQHLRPRGGDPTTAAADDRRPGHHLRSPSTIRRLRSPRPGPRGHVEVRADRAAPNPPSSDVEGTRRPQASRAAMDWRA